MFWRTLICTLLIPAFCFAQVPVVQQEPVENIPPGDDKIVPLKLNEPAPFAGQLFDNATALRWANWLQQYKLRLREDVRVQVAICRVELKYNADVLRLEQERNSKVEDDLRKRLSSSEQQRIKLEQQLLQGPPWYEGRTFGIIIGVASSAAVLSLSLWALEARK